VKMKFCYHPRTPRAPQDATGRAAAVPFRYAMWRPTGRHCAS
jgi:hypothetical protein